MLITIFKSNQRITNVLTLIVVVVFWFCAFYSKEHNFFINKWTDGLLSVGLITIQAIWLNRIVNQHKLIERSSYITCLIFVFLNSVVFFANSFSQILVANLCIIGCFAQLLDLYNIKNKAALLFNASLLVGIASILYYPYIAYFIFVWATLIYISTPKWRDFVISLIGFLIPIIYLVAYYFVFKDLDQIDWHTNLNGMVELPSIPVSLKILVVFIAVIIIVSAYVLLQIMSKSVVRVKKMLSVVLLMCLFSASVYIINEQNFFYSVISISIPLAIIIAAFFERLRKGWLAELIFSLLLCNLLWVYFS